MSDKNTTSITHTAPTIANDYPRGATEAPRVHLGGGFIPRPGGPRGYLSPDGDPSGGAAAPPVKEAAGEGDDLPDSLPKGEVSRIIQERLKRHEASILKRAGVASLEELEQRANKARELEAAAAEAERKRLEEAGQYKQLWEKTAAEKDAEIAKLNDQIRQREEAARAARVDALLTSAASRAVAPQQVAALIKASGLIAYGEDGAPYVSDGKGGRATDGKGGLLTVEAAVNKWLADNPHFLKASGAQGGGTPTGGGKHVGGILQDGEEEFDPARRHDPDHIRRARKSIMRLQAQRLGNNNNT